MNWVINQNHHYSIRDLFTINELLITFESNFISPLPSSTLKSLFILTPAGNPCLSKQWSITAGPNTGKKLKADVNLISLNKKGQVCIRPVFMSGIKQLRTFLFPLDRMPVLCRLLPALTGTHLYSWLERSNNGRDANIEFKKRVASPKC